VIVTMHTSKLKTKQELNSKSIKKGKDTRAHRSLRLLQELEQKLNSTHDNRQGFTCGSTTKLELLQVENYKKSEGCVNSTMGILI
jgi:hypothetical protein